MPMRDWLGGERAIAMAFAVCLLGAGCAQNELPRGQKPKPPSASGAAPERIDTIATKARVSREHQVQDEERLRAEASAIDDQTQRIVHELAALKVQSDLPAGHWAHVWAGQYFTGDGLGKNVAICVAPGAGITYTWHGCLGLYDGDHGTVMGTFDDNKDGSPDGISVDWTLWSKSGYGYVVGKYYFVCWNGPDNTPARRFLVPESCMLDVVNHYNEGGYARDGMYSAPLLNDEDGSPQNIFSGGAPVHGRPDLPEPWRSLLIKDKLVGEVTGVSGVTDGNVTSGVDFTVARITINKGRSSGVFAGMEVPVEGNEHGVITFDRVGETWAEGEYRAYTSAGTHAEPPKLGQLIVLAVGDADEEFSQRMKDYEAAMNEPDTTSPDGNNR